MYIKSEELKNFLRTWNRDSFYQLAVLLVLFLAELNTFLSIVWSTCRNSVIICTEFCNVL